VFETASFLVERKVNSSTFTSVVYLSKPSSPCHFLVLSLPSTYTLSPLDKYFSQISAALFLNTILCQSVFVTFSLVVLLVYVSLVAS